MLVKHAGYIPGKCKVFGFCGYSPRVKPLRRRAATQVKHVFTYMKVIASAVTRIFQRQQNLFPAGLTCARLPVEVVYGKQICI